LNTTTVKFATGDDVSFLICKIVIVETSFRVIGYN